MESLDKIAFWKNWEKITLFERKEKPQKVETKTVEEKSNFFQKAIERYSKNEPAAEKPATTINKPIENKAIAEIKPIVKPEEEKVLIHIIKSGNTLWGLSKQYYNRTSLWPNIYRKNVETLRTPDFLPVGRELLIPELIGDSFELSKADSARIAQGYYLAYNAYKKYDEKKANGYLKVAKQYSTTIR
jgi:LysM repeat protein